MNDALNLMGMTYGNFPNTTGAKTVYLPCYAFQAKEDTTFGAFYNSAGAELTFHPWKGKTVESGDIAAFGYQVAKFTITAGGEGLMYPSVKDLPAPVLLTKATNTAGTKVILTYDRKMTSPSSYAADFSVKVDNVANAVTAVALGSDTTTIEATVTTTIAKDAVVTISMTAGHVCSEYGIIADAIVNAAVTNNVP